MGYYTDFKLNFDGQVEEIPNGLQDECYVEDLLDEGFVSGKWYEWEEDMRLLSNANPEILFKLTGHGEEAGDEWKAYFKGGKCQVEKAVISYGEFNERKLK